MMPRVIAEFVAGAVEHAHEVGVLAHPFAGEEKGAANSCIGERREERGKRIGFAARVERQRDAVRASRSSLQLRDGPGLPVSRL